MTNLSKLHSLSVMKKSPMNQLEGRYADFLERQRLAGDIRLWMFEAVKLILAPSTTYMPDFLVINSECQVEFHEVKGFWRDDARVKIKVANNIFPFIFKIVREVKKQWLIEIL